ncbi:MAG: flagellar hook-associated protein FlgK [Porticoccaceae bacterium]
MADPLNISVSALLSYQRALSTASHNIANVNTAGYSRQRVDLGTQLPNYSGAGYLGNGVQVDGIRRVYNEFLSTQVRDLTATQREAEVLQQSASRIDNLLADPNAGLMPLAGQFFASLQDLANDPSSTAARQVVLDKSESLASRFRAFATYFDGLAAGVNSGLATAVEQVNALARQIGDLNQNIQTLSGAAGAPNDLLDQRDELIRQLSEYVAVSVVDQDNGDRNVFIGAGQPLVVGARVQQLTMLRDPYDPVRQRVGFVSGAVPVDITGQLTGGEIGGLLAFRDQVLDPAYNRLGQVAQGIAATMNAQHRLGMDLNGNIGGDLFTVAAPQALPRSSNTGDAVVGAAISDVSALTASDYRLDRRGTDYVLTRLSDGVAVDLDAAGFPGGAVTVDGLRISLASGSIDDGDSFLLQPTRGASASLRVAIADTNAIAAASPIRTSSAQANSGSGTISAGTVDGPPPVGPDLTATVTITFNDPPTSFNVAGAGTGDPANVPYVSGQTISYNGWTVQLSGRPGIGDTFAVGANIGGAGDNRNALALGALQTAGTLDRGQSTYADAYGNLVAAVAVRTERAQATSQAQGVLLNQATAARDNVSGVNLDEEAANLLRYQQAYQAAARVIEVANGLFDSILNAVRR